MFRKKKIEEPIPEPLTEKEIRNLKDKLQEKEDLSNLKIKDLKMSEIIPQGFKNCVINLDDNGKHMLYATEELTGDKFKTFRKSNGGVFNKDVINFTRDKENGKYVLIEGKGERKIVRLIEDNEILLFQTLKLINGIIKDKPYMILRKLQERENLTNTVKYIEKTSGHDEVEEVMNTVPLVIEEEEDHETNTTSVSLFDE